MSSIKAVTQTIKREINSRRIRAVNSIVFICYRCTSRCKTCNIWKWAEGKKTELKEAELTSEKFDHVIDKLLKYGIRTIEIFGGDALLRKDIVYSVLKRCNDLGVDTYFPCNSNLLDKETARELVSKGLGTIYFSIDGMDSLHDGIRGVNGTFNRVKKAIWNVYEERSKRKAKNPEIAVITTVSSMNVEMIDQILSELQNFPIDIVFLQPIGQMMEKDIERSVIDGIKPTPPFVSTSNVSHLLSERQFDILKQTLKKVRKKNEKMKFHIEVRHIDSLKIDTLTKGVFPMRPCHFCTTVATITPSGGVAPCPNFTNFNLGNLNGKSFLDDIWGNKRHRRFLQKQRSGELDVCKKCSMRHFYPGFKEHLWHVFYPYINNLL
ncbi:MAG: radical SAM protein [Desulfobacteraceae bacterium]|nr:radical SAM protein [Desulfobacteraceae bacterium]